jgi:hypothetical protein
MLILTTLFAGCAHDKKELVDIGGEEKGIDPSKILEADLESAHPIEMKIVIHPNDRIEILEIDGQEPSDVELFSTNEIIEDIRDKGRVFQGAIQVESFSVVTHQGRDSFELKEQPKTAFAAGSCSPSPPKHKHTTSTGREICHAH